MFFKSKKLINNNSKRLHYVLLFVSTFLLYSNSIKNEYALDDNYVTVTSPDQPNNPRIQKGIKGIPELFKTHYVETAAQSFEYRPLVLATFAIEYQFFGSNPHVSHFISILLYAITCVLLYHILCILFKKYHPLFSLFIAFLFMLHPIHTEVVDNIKCRDELLSFLFGICSLYFFLKNIENQKKGFIAWGILFLLMAMLCKKTSYLFIALIPLTIYFFTDIKLKKIAAYAAFPALSYLLLLGMRNMLIHDTSVERKFAFFENPLYYDASFSTQVFVAFNSLGYYLKLFIIPYPLSCYYGYDTISVEGWTSPFFIFSLLFYVFIGIYALIKLSGKSVLSYGILVYLGCIFPFANIIKPVVGIIGERFVYFTSLGFCIAASYLLFQAFRIDIKSSSKLIIKNLRMPFKLIIAGVFVLFSGLTIARNKKWKDEITLLRNDVGNNGKSCNLQYLIGGYWYPKIFSTQSEYDRDRMINEAKKHYKMALALMERGIKKYNTDYTTINNIGSIYMNVFNNPDSAWPYLKQAYAINPGDMIAQFNIAFCYEKRDRIDSAIIFYEKMLMEKALYLPAYIQLSNLYLKKNDYQKAILCNMAAIELQPNNPQIRVDLGNIFMLNKDTVRAIEQFNMAVQLDSANVNLTTQVNAFLRKIRHTQASPE